VEKVLLDLLGEVALLLLHHLKEHLHLPRKLFKNLLFSMLILLAGM
jgi:hypothetical protein